VSRNKDIKKSIADHLQSMVYWKTMNASAVPELVEFLDQVFISWEKSLVDELTEKVLVWEKAMGDEDKSLYTLGIRHSIDVIKGVPENSYQPMGEDFRGEKNQ
jgi:hypothetical protein